MKDILQSHVCTRKNNTRVQCGKGINPFIISSERVRVDLLTPYLKSHDLETMGEGWSD